MANQMTLTTTTTGTVELTLADFGILDEKARRVGGSIQIQTCATRWVNSTHTDGVYVAGYAAPCETYYAARVNPTRNDENFGATQPAKTYPTLEAARTASMKKLEAQAARYAKKYPAQLAA